MLFTRESDYGIRVLRYLADGQIRQVAQICKAGDIPKQYCYKIMKKLEVANLVESKRGRDGGYRMVRPVDSFSLLDVIMAVDEKFALMHCLDGDVPCPLNSDGAICYVHLEFARIQDILERELNKVPFNDLLPPTRF